MPNWRKILTSGSSASLSHLSIPGSVINPLTASFAVSSSIATTSSLAITASFAQTGSFLINPNISGNTTGVSTIHYNCLTGSNTPVLQPSEVSGEIVTFGIGVGLTPGMVYFLASSYQWIQASSNSQATSTNLLAIATGTTSQHGMLLRGTARFPALDNYSSGSVGSPVYLSTSGGFTDTAPSGVDAVMRIIGYTLSTSDRMLYFTPDNFWTVQAQSNLYVQPTYWADDYTNDPITTNLGGGGLT